MSFLKKEQFAARSFLLFSSRAQINMGKKQLVWLRADMIARFLAELIYTFPTHLSSLRAKTKPTKELKKKKLSFSLHLHCTLAAQLNGRFRNGKNPELAIYISVRHRFYKLPNSWGPHPFVFPIVKRTAAGRATDKYLFPISFAFAFCLYIQVYISQSMMYFWLQGYKLCIYTTKRS